MQTLLLTIHVLLAIGLVGLVLIQQGKGADAGAAFGSGSSATVFGAGGSGSFLTRMTTLIAALFFATSIALAVYAANRGGETESVVDQVEGTGEPAEQAGDAALPGDSEQSGQGSEPAGDLPPVDQ